MLKFVVAPDKFKGSLTGIQFCNAIEKGIKKELPNAEIIKLPLADGGDGTIEILQYHLHGKLIKTTVNDPLFHPIKAEYLYIDTLKTAFVEMAEASGMKLLQSNEQNCSNTTTLGTGELIVNAIRKGATTIILGIGGSATNDCGIGMATALGYQFKDENDKIVLPIGKNLSKITKIDATNIHPQLKNIEFKIACDVTNPLFGKNGAAFVYAPQKGASKNEIITLDEGLQHISKLMLQTFGINVQNIKGAGAAGGMGAGAITFLNGKLQSGINLIKELTNFDCEIASASWVITGEGKLDNQTLSGKTIQGVLQSANVKNIPVATLCGSISLSKKDISDLGVSYADAVVNHSKNIKDAINNSAKYVEKMAIQFSKNIKKDSIRMTDFNAIEQHITSLGFKISSKDFERPWGGFLVIDETQAQEFSNQFFNGIEVATLKISGKLSPKILIVKPNSRLSWQYHHRRAEIWRVYKGTVGIIRSENDTQNDIITLTEGDQVTLKQGERHRLIGLENTAIVAEIWQHTDPENPSNEEDIVRIQDDFGR